MRTRGHTLVVSEEWANRTNESIARGIAQQCRDEVATRGVAIEEAVGGSPLYRGCVERAERGTDVITPIAAPLGAISLDEALSTR